MKDDLRALHEDPLLKDVPEVDGFKVLAPCVLYSRLGQGGFGSVYRGLHVNLDIEVAVKCLIADAALESPDLIERFQREARIAASINDPHLIRVYDVLQDHKVHYIIMEYVKGETARQRVKRKGPLPLDEAFAIFRRSAGGLAAAHRKGIVHRDIKPANILISTAGDVKVADLGLAKVVRSSDFTAPQVVMGTPAYMPPEQWEGFANVGLPGDVHALGATFYFLLSGEDPYGPGSATEVMRRACLDRFPDLAARVQGVPADLARVLGKCTEKDPKERYPSAADLVKDLDRLEIGTRPAPDLAESGGGLDPSRFEAPVIGEEVLARVRTMVQRCPRGAGDTMTLPSAALEEAVESVKKGKAARLSMPRAAAAAAAGVAILGLAVLALARRDVILEAIGRRGRDEGLRVETRAPAVDGLEEAARVVKADSKAPVIRIEKPEEGHVQREDAVEVRGKVIDDGTIASVEVDGVPARLEEGGAFSISVPLRAEGENTITVRARDAAGNRTEDSARARRDSTGPEVQVREPPEGAKVRPGRIRVRGTVKDRSAASVRVNGAAAVVSGEEWRLDAVEPDARGTFRIEAADSLGNTLSIERSVTVVAPPEPPAWAEAVEGTAYAETLELPMEVKDKRTGIVLVLIPPGTYTRGAGQKDPFGRADEKPEHAVEITKPFYMGKFEVTNAEYRLHDPRHKARDAPELNEADRPVVEVSFDDASAFCARFGFRLPTEAEWEYACRGGSTTRYPWGDKPRDLQGAANFAMDPLAGPWNDGYPLTAPAGRFKPNPRGLSDMIGNVREWCAGFYDEAEYAAQRGTAKDPQGPERGASRVCRGGSFEDPPERCTPYARFEVQRSSTLLSSVGFRVARTP